MVRGLLARWAFAVVVLVATSMVSAQEPQPPPRDVAAWFEAVDAHVPGTHSESVRLVAAWSQSDLESVLPHVSRRSPADRLRIVERALVLHVDIVMAHRTPDGGYGLLATGPQTMMVLEDGQPVGQAGRTFHWAFARHLVERLPRGEERTRISRAFYRATAALLQSWSEYPELTSHLAAGRLVLGQDAVLIMYEGTQHQAYASAKIQRFLDAQRQSSRVRIPIVTGAPTGASPVLPTTTTWLLRAERWFRRAIAIDPALVEARIRLAHVLSDRGQHRDAAREIERMTRAAPLPPWLDYYAALVAGRVARARGDVDAARLAFERAAAIYPQAPAPRFGLSELAMAQGRRADSLDHLLHVNAAVRADEIEPWWSIERTHAPSALELVDDMRRAVAR